MKVYPQIGSRQKALDLDRFGPVSLVVIQAGSFCNIDCDYCYLPDRASKHRLPLELIAPIFEKLLTSPFVRRPFTVCWHAGEPLAVPITFYEDALTIVRNLQQQLGDRTTIDYSFQTNGLFLTQAWCDFLKKYRFSIGVSLDGPAFIHDAHRKTRTGLGTHAGTMRGIELLQKNQIDFQVIAVLTETSLDYPDQIFQFFRERRIDRVAFNVEEVEGVNRSSSLQKTNIAVRVRAFWQRFWELTARTNGAFQVREFEQMSELILKEGRKSNNQLSNPFSIISIDTQGNFSTYSPELLAMKSVDYGDFVLGNILYDTFESVCTSQKFLKLYRDIENGVRICQDTCQYFCLCGGGAPSNKYWENGTFSCSETMACRYNKQIVAEVALEGIEARLGFRSGQEEEVIDENDE